MKNLIGKVALVTGASRDIGRAISISLAKAGVKVLVNYYRDKSMGEETVSIIKNNGGDAKAVYADVTNSGDVSKMIKKSQEVFGNEVHILVNNVGGLFARKRISEIDENFYNLLMDVNFKSVFLVTKAIKPLMPEGGSIVNISSQAARDGGGSGSSLYSASKGAVTSYTRALAKEFGPDGIRVNAITAGMTSTRFHDDFTSDEIRKKVAGETPLGREGRPEEIADLAIYLASDSSSYITGANIDINGGILNS
ncbi:MAG: glucose 1-dehydrogenase [Flavobacteriaceae bacterium TMED121]|nr:MAG: glucose 1-dehydrogenase [Flavobacteriaceae bacterium TMED121]